MTERHGSGSIVVGVTRGWHRHRAAPLDPVAGQLVQALQRRTIMVPTALHGLYLRRHRVFRLAAARAGVPRLAPIAIAVDEPRVRSWAILAVRRAQLDDLVLFDRAELLDTLAAGCAAVIVGDRFDGLGAERLLAFIRAAGCQVPALVVADDPPDALLARADALGPIELLVAPRPALADAEPPRTRWLERCIELALTARARRGSRRSRPRA